jgi:hypothetical protein
MAGTSESDSESDWNSEPDCEPDSRTAKAASKGNLELGKGMVKAQI